MTEVPEDRTCGEPAACAFFPPVCGDERLESEFEECEGEEAGSMGSTCTPECMLNACGDGHGGPDEECDDANGDDGDGCESTCVALDSPVDPMAIDAGLQDEER